MVSVSQIHRLRRGRMHPSMRALLAETSLSVNDLILPLFIHHDSSAKHPIHSMPGQYQLGIQHLPETLDRITGLGIKSVILFGVPEKKDTHGSAAWDENGVVQNAIRIIRKHSPDLLVIADVCFCQYTNHGHCGEVDECGVLDNDATLLGLAKQSVSLAEAGAHVLAPSGMVDGMVGSIRSALEGSGHAYVSILSYAVKYASAYYGPFRNAAAASPQKGDRSTHQMDIRNSSEALREIACDIDEGADWAIIKPAGPCLDVIQKIHLQYPEFPLVGYQVSGEYAALIAAIEKGWLSESAILESLIAIKRSGCRAVITYFAEQMATFLTSR